jgi:oxygen-independent coproporphyrinogen-3 oxidase
MYDMYWFAQGLHKTAGYRQVSMRRFVKNIPPVSGSCGFETMLAIGCGGRSYLGKLHFCHPYAASRGECQKTIAEYINAPDKTRVTWGYILNEDEQKRRFVIKNILHVQGISFAEYREKFKAELCDDFPILREWEEQNYAQAPAAAESSGQIRLTPLGLSLSDCLGPALISAEVRQRMQREAERQK